MAKADFHPLNDVFIEMWTLKESRKQYEDSYMFQWCCEDVKGAASPSCGRDLGVLPLDTECSELLAHRVHSWAEVLEGQEAAALAPTVSPGGVSLFVKCWLDIEKSSHIEIIPTNLKIGESPTTFQAWCQPLNWCCDDQAVSVLQQSVASLSSFLWFLIVNGSLTRNI